MKNLKSLIVAASLMLVSTVQASSGIEIVAELNGTRPGNPTVTPAGRIILSQQPLDGPELRVVELMKDGSLQPFPNQDWADGPDKGEVGFSSVIGIDTTEEGIVYILDMGSENAPAQIVSWDSVHNRLLNIVQIDKAAMVANSFLQDFVIDTKRNKIYIADTTLGNLAGPTKSAFVVVNLKTGKSKRVLEADPSLMPPNRKVVINGSVMGTKREDGTKEPIYLGLNPITIDDQNEWVYFGTVNGSKIFRILANLLADDSASAEKLSGSIEFYSEKRPSDGMIMGPDGNIYVGDVEKNAVAISNKDEYRIIAQDEKLLDWTDGFSVDKKNGFLYMTQNQLHLHPALNEGEEGATKPYHIVRIKLQK